MRPTTVSDVSCVLNVSVDVKENIPILWSLHFIGGRGDLTNKKHTQNIFYLRKC